MSKRIKLDLDSFAYANLIAKTIKLPPKAVIEGEDLFYIIVPMGTVGKAIGKGAQNIKLLSQKLKKRIKIIEFHPHSKTFVSKIIAPIVPENITEDETTIYIETSDKKAKSLLIGRGQKNLNLLSKTVERFFHKEVKVK